VEYLAAAPMARNWDAGSWVAAMTQTSRRGVGVQALPRAPVKPDFLRAVVADLDGAIAAGHLLAAGAAVEAAVRTDVLVALLANWADPAPDPTGNEGARECRSLLMTLAADRGHREALRAIAQDSHRPTLVREAVALFLAARQEPSTVPASRGAP
jgi:hypothetical protein